MNRDLAALQQAYARSHTALVRLRSSQPPATGSADREVDPILDVLEALHEVVRLLMVDAEATTPPTDVAAD